MQIRRQLVILLAMSPLFQAVQPAVGQTAATSDEAAVVGSSAEVIGQIMSIPGRNIPESLLNRAEGIVIVPGMIKGGFIIGIRHGRGIMVTRNETGAWKPPLFVEMTGGSIGWQIGIQGIDLVLVFCTKNSLQDLHRGKLTIGANASAAAGPIGREAQAATDGRLSAAIYSYSRSRGLFAGLALDGAALNIDRAATNAYYQSVNGGTDRWPASASRLQEQLVRYTRTANSPPVAETPVGPMQAPIDRQAVRRQLAASSQQLAAILDPSWQKYLALPPEVYSNPSPSVEALRGAIDHFAIVDSDPRYQSLAQRPEFRATWSLLRDYQAALSPDGSKPLALPPPPH